MYSIQYFYDLYSILTQSIWTAVHRRWVEWIMRRFGCALFLWMILVLSGCSEQNKQWCSLYLCVIWWYGSGCYELLQCWNSIGMDSHGIILYRVDWYVCGWKKVLFSTATTLRPRNGIHRYDDAGVRSVGKSWWRWRDFQRTYGNNWGGWFPLVRWCKAYDCWVALMTR